MVKISFIPLLLTMAAATFAGNAGPAGISGSMVIRDADAGPAFHFSSDTTAVSGEQEQAGQRVPSNAQSLLPVLPQQGRKSLPEGAFPFDFTGSHIYIDMTLNDTVTGKWLFDTGAVNLYPDSTEFVSYPFERKAKRRFRGAGQNIVTLDVILDTITVTNGHASLTTTMSAILDVKKILGRLPAGIVGADLVRDTVLEINYSGEYMRLMDRSALPPAGYTAIPLEMHNAGILLMPLKVKLQSGEVYEGRFVYDTGSGGMLSVNSPAVREWGLDTKITNKIEQYTSEAGIGGESRQYLFRALNIDIGGHNVRLPLVDYSLNTEGVSGSADFDGIAGNLILSQFDHILDIRGLKLYIRPGKTYGKELRERVCGFYAIDRRDITDGFVVLSLDVGGAAERAGLQTGDVITHINGVALHDRMVQFFEETLQKPYMEYILSVLRNGEHLNFSIRNRGIVLINDALSHNHGIIRF